jgi:tetratricopeptide (TPR) repeat protein
VSQSPLEPTPGAQDAAERYRSAWSAINKLMRRGYSWSGREQNCAFLNLGGDRRLADVSAASGFDFPDDGRALARVDWDGDGDQDVILTARTGPRVRFLRNDQATGNAWVTLELRGTRANRDAIGARAELRVRDANGREALLVRAVRAGEGYLAQSSGRLTIGLGPGPVTVLEASVSWPGGSRERFEGVTPGRHHLLVEGTGKASPVPARVPVPAPRPLASGPVASPPASLVARVVLTRPVPLPRLAVETPAGETLELFGVEAGGQGRGTGRVVWISLFSTRCAPCARELAQLAERARELARAEIACLALCVDPIEAGTEDEAAAFLERLEWPFPWARASATTLETLDGLQGALLDRERRLPLPASFLVDASGALRALYLGPVEPATLLADRELCELGESAQLEAATPFQGRWMFPLSISDADFFEGRLTARGLPAVAAEYARGRLDVVRSSRADLLFDFGRRAAGEGRLDEALDFYRRCLEIQPDHVQALFDAAVVYHRRERFSEAAELYRRALAVRPGHVDTLFNLALALLGAGDPEAVEPLLRELQGRDPAAAEVLSGALEEWRANRAAPR